MKKTLISFAFLLTGFAFLNLTSASAAIIVTDNVQQIIDKSCYECHNSASSNKKAKKKFDFDKLHFLKKQQAIAEWDKVAEMVIEGEMPPQKFNKKYPDKRLTMNDKQVLTDWIKTLSVEIQVTLSTQLDKLTNQIIGSLDQNQKNKIAIMEFVDMQGNVSNFGKYISEELTTRLYRTGKFEVIERQLLDKIIQEQKISLSGIVDENSAVELGRILGVDAIATGTIGDLGISVKINARLISAESGKLFSVASVEIQKDDKVKVLLSQKLATTSSTTTSGTIVQAAASQTINKEGYSFEIIEARLKDKTLSCKLKVTNITEDDKEFMIRLAGRNKNGVTHTMMYDDLGNETKLTAVKAGENTTQMYVYPNLFKKKLFAGTSIIAELQFEKVSSKINEIVFLQILYEPYHEGKVLEFRNIVLNKN